MRLSEGSDCLMLTPLEGPGPTSRWKSAGVGWHRRHADDRLPTLMRVSAKTAEPWRPNGKNTCDAETLQRWENDAWRCAPYNYTAHHMLSERGALRLPTADERELLMDFPGRHTMTALPTKARKSSPKLLEDLRKSLIGDSFQCSAVALLLAPMLVGHRLLAAPLLVADMRSSPSVASVASVRESEQLSLLAKAHLAGADPRGSDVRLDSGELMEPKSWPRRPVDVRKWHWSAGWKTKWKKPDSITLLEALAAHIALLWRLRRTSALRTRFLHLIDNQAALSVLAKHRSTSTSLNRIARRSAALLLCAACRRALIYTETDVNPADQGSRE